MSADLVPTFRLLDGRVGWDPAEPDGLAGAVLAEGALMLAPARRELEGGLEPRLARGCGPCAWWLVNGTRLLFLGDCDDQFVELAGAGLRAPTAVAARGRLVAVVDRDRVVALDGPTGRLVGEATLPGATAVALDAADRLLVGDDRGRLVALDLSGLPCAAWSTDACAPVRAIAQDDDPACTVVAVHDNGRVTLLAGDRVTAGDAEDLAGLPDSGVMAVTDRGFCLAGRGCYGWDGRPLAAEDLGPGPVRHTTLGELRTTRLDSGIPRCRWHRVRVDADVPEGTSVAVALATTDDPTGQPGRAPHPSDWHDGGPGVTDFLVGTPPGRYAQVRVRLTGDGHRSPVVHQVRLDFPRATSLGALPAAFAEDPRAADFTERFLGLFDAELETVDDAVARPAGLLDPAALPDDALTWLASFLGLGFEAAMSPGQRRALLAAAPDLFRRRGTPGGLVDTLRLALGVEATVDELGLQRPWAALGGGGRLGGMRLFGRSTARVRLGSTALGSAPLNSHGNPDDDARLAGANRIRVHLAPTSGIDLDVVRRVVRSQSPALTEPSVRVAGNGFWLGTPRVGIDTVLVAPGPLVLGAVRLGRGGVLRHGGRGCAAVVGAPLVLDRGRGTE